MHAEEIPERLTETLLSIAEWRQIYGWAPTFRELASYLEIKSLNAVHGRLKALEQLGFIEREHAQTRAIRITEAGEAHIAAAGESALAVSVRVCDTCHRALGSQAPAPAAPAPTPAPVPPPPPVALRPVRPAPPVPPPATAKRRPAAVPMLIRGQQLALL
jgi:SOS-response transcriptional repressor LexA